MDIYIYKYQVPGIYNNIFDASILSIRSSNFVMDAVELRQRTAQEGRHVLWIEPSEPQPRISDAAVWDGAPRCGTLAWHTTKYACKTFASRCAQTHNMRMHVHTHLIHVQHSVACFRTRALVHARMQARLLAHTRACTHAYTHARTCAHSHS